MSIRSANAHNLAREVECLWRRLDERFGSLEMVQSSVKKKWNDFPKITNRDTQRLYDLADLLSEIQSVEENQQYQTLLAYFDSSAGVILVVRKLPYALQEKWTSQRSVTIKVIR